MHQQYTNLIEQALQARSHAYAPYSGFHVGAALLAQDGTVYQGSNIENCSYGATICAERTAFCKAISEGQRKFLAIAIAGAPAEEQEPLPQEAFPCGICRQFMAEFCDMDFVVIVAKSTVDYQIFYLKELLPNAFSPQALC